MDPKGRNVRNWNNISTLLSSYTELYISTKGQWWQCRVFLCSFIWWESSNKIHHSLSIAIYMSNCLELANFCKTDLKHMEIFQIYSTTMTKTFLHTKMRVNPFLFPLDQFAFVLFFGNMFCDINTLKTGNGRKQHQGLWQCHSVF